MLYPVCVHFGITEAMGGALLFYWMNRYDNGLDIYYQNAIMIIGVTGILTMIPSLIFYRNDRRARIQSAVTPSRMRGLNMGEGVLLLGMGASLAMFGNLFMALCQMFLQSSAYQESMEQISAGKDLSVMIFWMGIVAPVAEELIFRWLVFLRLRDYMRLPAAAMISGLIFGIYHGNILQAVYAAMLGFMFAYLLEMTGNLWSCILLHIGANVWSLVYPELLSDSLDTVYVYLVPAVLVFLLAVLSLGIWHFFNEGRERNRRMI